MSDTIYIKEGTGVHVYKVCVIPDRQIDQIADAVVKKLAGDEEKMTFMDIIREMAGEELRYCDRNICASNEVNGVPCDECWIAQNYNLEDDDSPCLNCGEEDDAD